MRDDTHFDRDPRGYPGSSNGSRTGAHGSGTREEGIVRADSDFHASYDVLRYAPMRDQMAMQGRWFEEEQEGIDIRQFLAMLRRRKKVLLTTFLAVVGLGLAYTLMVRPLYVATSKLLVDTKGTEGESMDLTGLTKQRSVETQVEILKSAPVQRGARQRLAQKPKIRAAVARFAATEIKPVREADIIDVVVTSYSPDAAAALANAIVNEYIDKSRMHNQESVKTAANYIGTQLQTVKKQLDQARTALTDFKTRNKTVDPETESKGLIGMVAQVESDMRQASAEKMAAEAELSKLRSLAASLPEIDRWPTGEVQRPEVSALRQQLTQLEMKRTEVLEEYQPSSPEVQQIEGQIAALRQQLNREARTEIPGYDFKQNPVKLQLNQDIAKLQGQVWATQARSQALAATAQRLRSGLAKLPKQEQVLGQLNTDLAARQKTYDMLNEKYQTLQINKEARVANATVLSYAQVPGSPVFPRKGLNIAVSVVLGLILAVGLAALLEHLDDRVHSSDEAELISQLPVLAQVPYIKEKEQRFLVNSASRNPLLLESFRMLRTNIAFPLSDESIRSIAVTSGLPHEGKSISAVNLAIVMALNGKKVILVDADLRRPSLHRLFGLSNEIGFTSVMTGLSSLEDALQETKVPGLLVLTSGPLPANPSELLDSPAGRNTLQQMKEQTDFVVVDSPPALVTADAHIISTIIDAVLLVVSSKDAGKREIIQTRRLPTQTGAKMLGIVPNKVTSEVDGLHSYYDYGGYLSTDGHDKELAVAAQVPYSNGTRNGEPQERQS